MPYVVRVKPVAEKSLKKIPNKYRVRILLELQRLTLDPFAGKKLEGEYQGHYSVRVWPYRIIYKIYKHELLVLVIKIGHRQGVY